MNQLPHILITSGETKGVGSEILLKAFNSPSLQRIKAHWCILGLDSPQDFISKLDHSYNTHEFIAPTLVESLSPSLQVIQNNLLAAQQVELATKLCLNSPDDWQALVTGPLTKESFISAGFNVMGHTGLFKKLHGKSDLFMSFIGQKFSVVLVTDHIPLKDVEDSLTQKNFKSCFNLASELNSKLYDSKKTLAVLGLNPHAGDAGLIGSFEDHKLKPWLQDLGHNSLPLPPDSAFTPEVVNRYDLYLSLYHDQGLIAFKTAHGMSGYQMTLGLPFIRTSVDHGPAFELYGLNQANPRSMMDALLGAYQMSANKIEF